MTATVQRTKSPRKPDPAPSARRLEELEFLAEVARLTGSARTWEELMSTIVDRATAAARAEVCSLYLMDRDGSGVTLAATNGLDPEQIGHARLPLGKGITVHHEYCPNVKALKRNPERFTKVEWEGDSSASLRVEDPRPSIPERLRGDALEKVVPNLVDLRRSPRRRRPRGNLVHRRRLGEHRGLSR